jgi:phospholipid/cholesterol/gamma-HCH transport system substrate-binding protein
MFDMKKRLRWSMLKAGVVVTLALMTLFLAVIFTGTIEGILSPSIELRAHFRDVKGLRKGAPVWLFGTEVGSVKSIQLAPAFGTIVTLSVKKNAVPFVMSDSHAEVLTMGLLGDKYIELTSGSPAAGPIHPGDMVIGTTPAELTNIVEASAKTVEKVSGLIDKVESLITSIAEGKGTLAKLINESTLYDNLERSTAILSSTLEGFENSRGTLYLLLNDPSLYNQLAALTSSLEGSIRILRESAGTLKKLVEDPSLYGNALAAVSNLERFARKLNQGQGSLGRFLDDPALYQNLNLGAENLTSILSRIERGEGVAGALIRDEKTAMEVKNLLVSIEVAAEELKNLLKNIQEDPQKYFHFSLF